MQQESGRTAHHGRRHAGAAELEVGRTDHVTWDGSLEYADARRADGHNPVAGSDDVWFDEVIEAGRSLGTVACDKIVAFRQRALCLHCTNSNDVRIVGRRRDCGVTVRAERIVSSLVTGRGHNHDAGCPRAFHSLTEGVQRVAFKHRPPKRKIDHANVVLTLQGNGAVDGLDHVAVPTSATVVQNAQVNDVGSGGDAQIFLVGILSNARDDARHMSPMAVSLIRAERDKALRIDHAASQVRRVRYTAINHRNADTGTVEAETSCYVCPDRRIRIIHSAVNFAIR